MKMKSPSWSCYEPNGFGCYVWMVSSLRGWLLHLYLRSGFEQASVKFKTNSIDLKNQNSKVSKISKHVTVIQIELVSDHFTLIALDTRCYVMFALWKKINKQVWKLIFEMDFMDLTLQADWKSDVWKLRQAHWLCFCRRMFSILNEKSSNLIISRFYQLGVNNFFSIGYFCLTFWTSFSLKMPKWDNLYLQFYSTEKSSSVDKV